MVELSRRTALGLGGALSLSALLAACSSPASTAGGSAATGDLRIWTIETSLSDKAKDWLKSTFEEQNPGSTLTFELQVWDGYVSKLQTALASADSTPDLVELGNTQAPTFCSVGALMDITDMTEELGGADLTQSLVALGSYEDKMYAAPFYAGSRVFIYRKDWFEQLGLSVPTTLDELTTVAGALQAANPGGNPNFSAAFIPGIDWQACIAWIFTHGSNIATVEDGEWTAQLSSPESQAALEQLQQLWSVSGTAGQITDQTTANTAYAPFNAGESAMFFGFAFQVPSIDPQLIADDRVGYFAFPGLEAGEPGHSFAGGSNIAISANTQNADLSREVMRLIFSQKFQEMFATEGGWVPGNVSYASALGDGEMAVLTASAVENSVGTPAARNWALVESARTMEDFTVALGAGGDPVALAADTDAALNRILNQS